MGGRRANIKTDLAGGGEAGEGKDKQETRGAASACDRVWKTKRKTEGWAGGRGGEEDEEEVMWGRWQLEGREGGAGARVGRVEKGRLWARTVASGGR